MSAAREMTLAEYVERLHPQHTARLEYERIAAALNQQAGVVAALRPLGEAVERLDNARHGNDFVGTICAQSQVIEAARAALASLKGEKP